MGMTKSGPAYEAFVEFVTFSREDYRQQVLELREQNDKQHKLIVKLIAAMGFVCDELEEDFDVVDGSDGQPAPNKAMRLASELKEAIYGPGGF